MNRILKTIMALSLAFGSTLASGEEFINLPVDPSSVTITSAREVGVTGLQVTLSFVVKKGGTLPQYEGLLVFNGNLYYVVANRGKPGMVGLAVMTSDRVSEDIVVYRDRPNQIGLNGTMYTITYDQGRRQASITRN